MLSNTIALIAVAALFGIEAWKANGGPARLVLTALAVAFALWGTFLEPLTNAVPTMGKLVADTFSQPAAWFVLLMGLFFVVRPLWASKPTVRSNPYPALAQNADVISHNITTYRGTRRVFRDMLPSLMPTVHQGLALLVSFEKSGFSVPNFETREAERIAVGMEHYFTVIAPMLRAGHVEEAKGLAVSLSEAAEQRAVTFQTNKWWTHNDYY
jgi:hypothetical protein